MLGLIIPVLVDRLLLWLVGLVSISNHLHCNIYKIRKINLKSEELFVFFMVLGIEIPMY